MKLFTLSCILTILAFINATPVCADNITDDDPQSLTVLMPDQSWEVDQQQGFCFYHNTGVEFAELKEWNDLCMTLEHLSITFEIASEALPSLKGQIPEAYERIESLYMII